MPKGILYMMSVVCSEGCNAYCFRNLEVHLLLVIR